VVSRAVGNGKFFAQKGIVQDVLDASQQTCILQIDGPGSQASSSSRGNSANSGSSGSGCGGGGGGIGGAGATLEGVVQSQLDTALPKRGAVVCVVRGERRGEKGRLLLRDSERNRATVQMLDDMAVEAFRFEEVAEFCFDLHDLE